MEDALKEIHDTASRVFATPSARRSPSRSEPKTGGEDFISFEGLAPLKESKDVLPTTKSVLAERQATTLKASTSAGSSRGKKRSFSEMLAEDDEDYANKKQRQDAMVRNAPWSHNIDWDSCNTPAEMFVLTPLLSAACAYFLYKGSTKK
jgi:hypothetical protein